MALATYPMARQKDQVGLALIISMEKGRDGGTEDRIRLETLFGGLLQFEVMEDAFRDQSAEVVTKTITKRLAKACDVDCFVLSINGHGGTTNGLPYIYDSSVSQGAAEEGCNSDAKKIFLIDDIINPVCSAQALQGKPKVFLVNACRGTVKVTQNQGMVHKDSSLHSDEGLGDLIEQKEDVFLVFSTDEGEQSHRHSVEGTLFVQSLYDVVSGRFRHNTVPNMMDEVAGKLRLQASEQNIRQIVCRRSYLTKQLYWSPIAPIRYGGIKRLTTPTHKYLLTKQVDALKDLLQLERKDRSIQVLLRGMGGVGKSTAAKGLHDDAEIQEYFQGAVAYVELGEDSRLTAPLYHSAILKQLLNIHREDWHFGDDAAGADRVTQELNGRRVLLILDNVWEGASLNLLEKLSFQLAVGSRVVITSRSELPFTRDLRWGKEVVYKVQEMVELSPGEAREVLRWRVEDVCPEADFTVDLEELLTPIAEVCGGLPLAIDVVGAWLADRRGLAVPIVPEDLLRKWKETLRKIKVAINCDGSNEPPVSRILRSSYVNLDLSEKEMFLNTAAFVQGQPLWVESFCRVFVAGKNGRELADAEAALENLQRRSMLRRGGHPNLAPIVEVHDLLRELARELVNTEPDEKRERLFLAGKEVDRTRLAAMHLEKAVGLSLSGTGVTLEDDGVPWRMFDERDGAPFLRVAQLDQLPISKVPAGIKNWRKTLRLLDLSHSYQLVDLPDEIGDLSELRVLSVAHCRRLRTLPSSMSKLKLEVFSAQGCCNLASLPLSFGNMTMFKHLWIWRATTIEIEREGSEMSVVPYIDQNKLALRDRLAGVKPLILVARTLDESADFYDGRSSLLSKICEALSKYYEVPEHYDALLEEGVIHVLAAIGSNKRKEHEGRDVALYGTRWQALHAMWNFAFAEDDSRFREILVEPSITKILMAIVTDSSESPDLQVQVAGCWRQVARMPEIARMLRQLGAVNALLEALRGSSNHAELYQYACSALTSFCCADPESCTLLVREGGLEAILLLINREVSRDCSADAIRLLSFFVATQELCQALASSSHLSPAVMCSLGTRGPPQTYELMLYIVLRLLRDRELGGFRNLEDVKGLTQALLDGTARGWSGQISATPLVLELLALLGPGRVVLVSDEGGESTACCEWSPEMVNQLMGRTTSPLRSRLEAFFLLLGCRPEAAFWLQGAPTISQVLDFLLACFQTKDLPQLAAAVLFQAFQVLNGVPGRAGELVVSIPHPFLAVLTEMLNAGDEVDGLRNGDPQENVLLALLGMAKAVEGVEEGQRGRFFCLASDAGLLVALARHTERLDHKLLHAQAGRVQQQAEGDNISRWRPAETCARRTMSMFEDALAPFELPEAVSMWGGPRVSETRILTEIDPEAPTSEASSQQRLGADTDTPPQADALSQHVQLLATSTDHFEALQRFAELLRSGQIPGMSEVNAAAVLAGALAKYATVWGNDVRCLELVRTLLQMLADRSDTPLCTLRTMQRVAKQPVGEVTCFQVEVLLGYLMDGSPPYHILPRLVELYVLAASGKDCARFATEKRGLEVVLKVAAKYEDECVRSLAAAVAGTLAAHEDAPSGHLVQYRFASSATRFLLERSAGGETGWVFAISNLATALQSRRGSSRGVWLAAFGQHKQCFKSLVTQLEGAAGASAGALKAAAEAAASAYRLLLEPDVANGGSVPGAMETGAAEGPPAALRLTSPPDMGPVTEQAPALPPPLTGTATDGTQPVVRPSAVVAGSIIVQAARQSEGPGGAASEIGRLMWMLKEGWEMGSS